MKLACSGIMITVKKETTAGDVMSVSFVKKITGLLIVPTKKAIEQYLINMYNR